MAKFSRISKLTLQRQEKLLIGFCKALVELKTPEEAASFIKDLLSKQEAEMLAKRIEIARLLIEGKNYAEIKSKLKASYGTIARVSHWLATSGEGYRLIVQRVKPVEKKSEKQELMEELQKPFSWKLFKRRHSAYFWPELLFEEVVKTANKRQKEKLRGILKRFDEKGDLFKRLDTVLQEKYRRMNTIK